MNLTAKQIKTAFKILCPVLATDRREGLRCKFWWRLNNGTKIKVSATLHAMELWGRKKCAKEWERDCWYSFGTEANRKKMRRPGVYFRVSNLRCRKFHWALRDGISINAKDIQWIAAPFDFDALYELASKISIEKRLPEETIQRIV